MTTENTSSGDCPETSEELQEEILQLREALAAKDAELSSVRERHATLSRAINIGYWEWDETTKQSTYFSEEMAATFGMSLERLHEIYKNEEDIYSFIHPDDLQHYIANLSAVLDPAHPRGLAHTFDYRIVRPNGEVRFVRELEYGVQETDGVVTRSFGAIQDMTDIHESTQARLESEQRYDTLFSQLPFGAQEQDWSGIKTAVDKLRADGVDDLKAYFDKNPDLVKELIGMISITNANDALVKIYGAGSVKEYI